MEKLFQIIHYLQFWLLPLAALLAYLGLVFQGKATAVSDGFTFFSIWIWVLVFILSWVYSSEVIHSKRVLILLMRCLDAPFLLFLMYLVSPVGLDFLTCLILYFLLETNALVISWVLFKTTHPSEATYFYSKEDTWLLLYLMLCAWLINFTVLGLHTFEVLLQIGLLGQLLYGFGLISSVYFYRQGAK